MPRFQLHKFSFRVSFLFCLSDIGYGCEAFARMTMMSTQLPFYGSRHSLCYVCMCVCACRYFTSCLCVYFDAVRQKKKLENFLHFVSVFFILFFYFFFFALMLVYVVLSNVKVYFVQRSNDKLDTKLLKA